MKKTLLAITIFCSSGVLKAQDSLLKLWYLQPAGDNWLAALPLGNGRLGAMVYGNPSRECIQLNESTIWTGSPNRNDNCLLYTSDAADDLLCVDLGGRRII